MEQDRPQPEAPTEKDPNAKRALHAYLSDNAHETWHSVAADLGASVSAMLEAMAAPTESGDLDVPHIDQIVKTGRKIDADRRRR